MNKEQLRQIIKEELQEALDEETSSPYYAEQARLGKIRQMGHDDAVAGKEPSSTMAIYRVGYQAGMKSKEESQLVSKHGSDISPWSVAQDLEINQEISDNAHAANEIEDFISQRLIKLAGPVEQWTDKHLETFEQINNLLNVLFPSGK